jgi:hypothetical protein
MTGIRQVLKLQSVSGHKKAELRQYLMDVISDPDRLADIVADLNDTERAAPRDLLDHGGVMGYEEFTQAYGAEEERSYLEYHATSMKSVMGRLRARGLLFAGTADNRVVVATPRELRPLLRQALEQARR